MLSLNLSFLIADRKPRILHQSDPSTRWGIVEEIGKDIDNSCLLSGGVTTVGCGRCGPGSIGDKRIIRRFPINQYRQPFHPNICICTIRSSSHFLGDDSIEVLVLVVGKVGGRLEFVAVDYSAGFPCRARLCQMRLCG